MNELVDFYEGTEVAIIGLRYQLDAIGVFSLVQNDFHSGNLGGFLGGTADTIRLKIRKNDIPIDQPILDNFLRTLFIVE